MQSEQQNRGVSAGTTSPSITTGQFTPPVDLGLRISVADVPFLQRSQPLYGVPNISALRAPFASVSLQSPISTNFDGIDVQYQRVATPGDFRASAPNSTGFAQPPSFIPAWLGRPFADSSSQITEMRGSMIQRTDDLPIGGGSFALSGQTQQLPSISSVLGLRSQTESSRLNEGHRLGCSCAECIDELYQQVSAASEAANVLRQAQQMQGFSDQTQGSPALNLYSFPMSGGETVPIARSIETPARLVRTASTFASSSAAAASPEIQDTPSQNKQLSIINQMRESIRSYLQELYQGGVRDAAVSATHLWDICNQDCPKLGQTHYRASVLKKEGVGCINEFNKANNSSFSLQYDIKRGRRKAEFQNQSAAAAEYEGEEILTDSTKEDDQPQSDPLAPSLPPFLMLNMDQDDPVAKRMRLDPSSSSSLPSASSFVHPFTLLPPLVQERTPFSPFLQSQQSHQQLPFVTGVHPAAVPLSLPLRLGMPAGIQSNDQLQYDLLFPHLRTEGDHKPQKEDQPNQQDLPNGQPG